MLYLKISLLFCSESFHSLLSILNQNKQKAINFQHFHQIIDFKNIFFQRPWSFKSKIYLIIYIWLLVIFIGEWVDA